jgi:SHS2 domain-containing protein
VKDYELIEHTADVGIRVKAADLEGVFINAGLAMFDIMAGLENPDGKNIEEITIKQNADTLDELFINWLNELLSLSAVKELIFTDFKINLPGNNNLQATLIGCDIKNYKINSEIKAATYHQLKLEQTDSGWLAEVIFDV